MDPSIESKKRKKMKKSLKTLIVLGLFATPLAQAKLYHDGVLIKNRLTGNIFIRVLSPSALKPLDKVASALVPIPDLEEELGERQIHDARGRLIRKEKVMDKNYVAVIPPNTQATWSINKDSAAKEIIVQIIDGSKGSTIGGGSAIIVLRKVPGEAKLYKKDILQYKSPDFRHAMDRVYWGNTGIGIVVK